MTDPNDPGGADEEPSDEPVRPPEPAPARDARLSGQVGASPPPDLSDEELAEGERLAAAAREQEPDPSDSDVECGVYIEVPDGWTAAEMFGAIVSQAEPVEDSDDTEGR